MSEKQDTISPMIQTEDEKYIVDYIRDCIKTDKEASKDRREAWKELWNAYQNKQDFTGKEDWQSTVFAPKVWMKVKKASAEVKRAFINIGKLFKFALDDRNDWSDQQRQFLMGVMPKLELRFKRELEDSNLSNVYSEASECGFLLGLALPKCLWDYENDKLNYENAEALNTYISPDYKPFEEDRPKHIIEETEMPLADFRIMTKKINEAAGFEVYDLKKIEKIESEVKPLESDTEKRQAKGISQYRPVSKTVHLWLFWGDIIDKTGMDKTENVFCVVANKEYLVRRQDNPFNHGGIPHQITFPMVFPHRGIAGCSLVEPTAKIVLVYNNLLNMYIDNMNFSVNRMFEYDPNRLLNPKSVMRIKPGKKVEKIGDPDCVRIVDVPSVAKDAIPGLDTLSREIQEGTSVTEFIEGMPTKKTKTLGEVEIKTAESRGLFDTIARDLEQNSIKPLLEKSYALLVQFKKFPDIEGKFVIKVGGLSLLMQQKETIENVERVLGAVTKVPALAQMTDIDDLWQKYLGILNLQESYIPPEQREQMPMDGEGDDVEEKAKMDAKKIVQEMQNRPRLAG